MSEGVKGDLKHNCENHAKCMEMIQAVLDGSATQEELNHMKSEMDTCLPCIEGYELEKTIKEALNMRVEKKCCPEKTVSKIKEQLGISVLVLGFVAMQVKLFLLIIS